MSQSKVIATCGVMAALGVVIMIIGGVLGIGMYASPMIVGFCLIPIGEKYGRKYQVYLWIVISILSFMLVPDIEQNLMFLCLFGLYPILYPYFQKLPKGVRVIAKLAFFNTAVIGLEWLVMKVLMPEIMATEVLVVLLIAANLMLLGYDWLIPRSEYVINRYVQLFTGKGKKKSK